MTAEVAIINRFGIAIAADSAVTIGEQRVWKSTNKIFSLGPSTDAAIMIYGGGDFLGCPWEIIIKSFREYRRGARFDYISNIVDEFSEFLKRDNWSDKIIEPVSFYSLFVKEIEELEATIEADDEQKFNDLLGDWIKECKSRIEDNDICLNDLDYDTFKDRYYTNINEYCSEIFSFSVSEENMTSLAQYLYEYTIKCDCPSGFESGVVFAGYGELEKYPVVHEIIVDGRHAGNLRFWPGRINDLNKNITQVATVIPFAQRDMTNVFMEAISPAHVAFFFHMMSGLLARKSKEITKLQKNSDERKTEQAIQRRENAAIMKEIAEAYQSWRDENVVDPLMDSIRSLPREEMAAMAEALVELTSLRRKIDSNLQSVAGPVDVAFISKGDGLIWMKRKHYFEAGLNSDFFDRRRSRYGH